MNALLLYPKWPDTYWSFKHALPFQGKRSSYPPLGLLTIAALLPTDWVKRLVDTNVRALTDSDMAWARSMRSNRIWGCCGSQRNNDGERR